MALGEAESSLFGLFTNQSANVFEPMSAGFECLDAGSIQNGSNDSGRGFLQPGT
jgi:hypothetical protein